MGVLAHGLFLSTREPWVGSPWLFVSHIFGIGRRSEEMTVSKKIEKALEEASWVRKMFEEGNRLKRMHGPE